MEALRFGVVHSKQLAHQHTPSAAAGQAQDAAAVAAHGAQGPARWLACLSDVAAAIAESEGHRPGQRGRRPRPWRQQAVRYRSVADTRRTRPAQRGRPPKPEPPPMESGQRLVVEVARLANPEADNGWTGLATPVSAAACTEAEVLQAYPEQPTTVAPGLRWRKHPAAISPGWLEKPARMAALARLTVGG